MASSLEYQCAICLQILIEPVVLPCKHEMCRPCFRKNVEEANFLCPMCRKRIASWARKCIREGTLVDQNRWNVIQERFPKKCLRRLHGEDDDSEDESYEPLPKRILAKSGELRQEYEQEMHKLLQEKQEEEQASRDLIKNILEEEEACRVQQEKEDEDLARRLSKEIKQSQSEQNNNESMQQPKNDTSNMKSKDLKRKKMSRTGQIKSYTLDKYFLTKDNDSGNSSSTEQNVSNKEQHKSDYDLALTLQKQFDRESVTLQKRDDYMLRNTTSDKNILNEQSKYARHKNGHSITHTEHLRNGLLEFNGERSDEENVDNLQIPSSATRLLRNRTI